MLKKRHILVLLIGLLGVEIVAQNTTVVFRGEIPFQLSINNKKQFEGFKTEVKITSLSATSQYRAKCTFKNDSSVNGKLFLLNEHFTHFFDVEEKSIQFKKAVPSIGLIDTTWSTDYIKGDAIIAADTLKDTLKTDTSYVVPFANYYRLEDYKGRIGCPFPIKDEELNKLIDAINAEDLEDLKLEKAKLAIQDMDSACVLIEQTKTLIQRFEYEETRLSFAKFMYIYTFDIDNYFKLNEVFNFENSRQELKKYVGMQIDKSKKTKND